MKKILIAVALLACGTRLLGQAAKNYPTSPAVPTYSDLSTKLANGQVAICSDCTKGSDPCTSGGTGAFVYKMNSVSVCGGGGGGGAGTKTLFLNFAAHGGGDSAVSLEIPYQTNIYTNGDPNNKIGVGTFSNTGGVGEAGTIKWKLPATFVVGSGLTLKMLVMPGSGGSGGNFDVTPTSSCFGASSLMTSLTYNSGSLVSTAMSSTPFTAAEVTLTIPLTGCSAGNWINIGLIRSSSDTNADGVHPIAGELSGTW